jgi:hypothetical protein
MNARELDAAAEDAADRALRSIKAPKGCVCTHGFGLR